MTAVRQSVRPSFGTWARTLGQLRTSQILGRPSYRLRRLIAPDLLPPVCRLLRPNAAGPAAALAGAPTAPFGAAEREALAFGQIVLHGQKARLPEDAPFEPSGGDALYAYGFHEFGWLRAALADEDLPKATRAELVAWLARYLAHDFPSRSVHWDPYPTAGRILQLSALQAAHPAAVPPDLGWHLARWTLALAGLMETHLAGNHLLRNRVALAVGACRLAGVGADGFLSHAWSALAAEAGRQLLSDCGHEERTPSYHVAVAVELLMAIAAARAAPGVPPFALDWIEILTAGALGALGVMAHEDGRVAAFGDTAPESVPAVEAVVAFGQALGLKPASQPEHRAGRWRRQTLAQSGFTRLSGSGLSVHVTHGSFGAGHQPGHAHCDLFAFEVDVGGRRVIVDPGVHGYHDPEWRHLSRASAEHATPNLADREQAEIWSRFRCGWRPGITEARWEAVAGGWRFTGEATAFGPHASHRVRRTLIVREGTIEVGDQLDPARPFSVALTLAPGIEPVVDGKTVALGDTGLRLAVAIGARVVLENAYVSHRFGERTPARRVRLQAGAGSLGFRFEVPR